MRFTIHFAFLGLAVAGSSVPAHHRETQDAEEQCFVARNRLMGLFNFEAPWPIQCTLCAEAGEEACFGQPCWCVPEGGSSGCCPDPGERPLVYEWQVSDAFRANKLTLSDPFTLTPVGCEPWDINIEVTFPGSTKCDAFPLVDNPDAVCAYIYPEDDQNCGGLDPREYGMESFETYDAAIAAGAVPTHLGACGVCSNAQDLAAFIDPRAFYDGSRGLCAGFTVANVEAIQTIGQPIREGLLYECYRSIGLTEDCSFHHATSDVAGSYTCTEACLPVLEVGQSPNDFETCLPNGCLECELDVRGNEYLRWAGRNLYRSGIIGYNEIYQIKVPCSDYQDNPIKSQNPYNPTKTLTDPTPNDAESADRFAPSYSLLLNQESCFYDFSFSVRHDPTLPHAGGWDPSLPNSVTREEFDAVCARGSNEIADDGLPYRQRRMFDFVFGEDVKVITGLFDHISIDYNPCGHHDEIFFGRPHYDFHFYVVQKEYRDIMRCETTDCDPQDCKYDATFQSTESGKAFFEMGQCSEPFPSYIPADTPVKPGAFNRNMPFGFVTLSHTGNVRSGLHSLNAATAGGWNETQVDRWDEPVQFYMSFNDNIVVWEPMVPVEFLQGSESRTFNSPETPPLCQTLAGLPLTYNAIYNAETGFTTFQILGQSPFCACLGNPASGLLTSDQCATNEAELKKYDETYAKFTNGQTLPPRPAQTSPFGKFTVAEVEAAFGFTEGSLILKGTSEFDRYTANNSWVEYIGLPLILTRLTQIVATPRNDFQSQIAALGSPAFVYQEEAYFEQPLLGCFYRPKSEDIDMLLQDSGLGLCTGEPGAFTGVIVPYNVVGYIDQYTRLLYFGTLAEFADDIQFMTQLVVAEIQKDATLADGEVFVYQLKGPSFGAYDGFADSDIESFEFLGNHGHFEVAVTLADLNGKCPDEFCGNIVEGIPNELAPEAPWPTKILDNQCIWFPCDELDACADVDPSVSPFYEQCGRKFVDFDEILSPTFAPTLAPSGAAAFDVLRALASLLFVALFF